MTYLHLPTARLDDCVCASDASSPFQRLHVSVYLDLNSNTLSGSIPFQLGLLSLLRESNVDENGCEQSLLGPLTLYSVHFRPCNIL